MNTATALVLVGAMLCTAAVLVVRMFLESQDRGKGRLILSAEQAAKAAALQAEESARHAAAAKATVDEMQGTLTALSVRLGLRGKPMQGYPHSEPVEPKG